VTKRDISGEKFGLLTATEEYRSTSSGRVWKCICGCGQEVERTYSRLIRGKSISCGCVKKPNPNTNNLHNKTFGRLTVKERVDNDRHHKSRWRCECECGGPVFVIGSDLLSGKTTSCGCYKNSQVKDNLKGYQLGLQGHKNPNWKGGKSTESHLIRTSKAYKEWRDDVFRKYDYSCQRCQKRGGDIEAHHILNFSKYKDERLNRSNGIVFCKICHRDFHTMYGNQANNYSQVLKFVGN